MIVSPAARSGRFPPDRVIKSVFNLVHAMTGRNNQTFTMGVAATPVIGQVLAMFSVLTAPLHWLADFSETMT
jgi:hypothetical protein